MTYLLVLIYIAFISLGIPDSLLGAAWPAMHTELGIQVSLAGTISMIVSCGTVVSSMLSARVIARFGTGKVTAISVLMTTFALYCISKATSYSQLMLCAIPLGLGAGAVDSALNNFVAMNYQAKHMNWLHCFWGIGASLGPMIIGTSLTFAYSWRYGYAWIAAFQAVLSIILLFSLPLWRKTDNHLSGANGNAQVQTVKVLSVKQMLSIRLVKPTLGVLLAYCGAEGTMGLWCASYLVVGRGMQADTAASYASLFFIGITAGRLVSGFLSMRLSNMRMIRLGQCIALAGIALLILPLPTSVTTGALLMIGLGFAPIYPAMIHQTPRVFGGEVSQSMMGVQMAFAYVGSTFAPPFFGIISGFMGIDSFPLYLLLFVFISLGLCEYLQKKIGLHA